MKNKKSKPKRVILKKGHFQEYYQQMLKVAPLVLEILRRDEKTRDYDNLLYIQVWKAQGMKESDSCKKFKYNLIIGKFSTPETIRRARQKLQATPKYKDLRGNFYKQRQTAEAKMSVQLALW